MARGAAGLLVGLGSTIGCLVFRCFQGASPRAELATHGATYASLLLAMSVAVTGFGYALGRVEARLRRANQKLTALASTDDLTGLLNPRVFHEQLPRLLSLARRAQIELSLVMLDLDYFKRINDTYGHSVGDHVLTAVSRAMCAGRRREDLAARVGGEEFALVLPGVSARGAYAAAERVLAAVRAIEIPGIAGTRLTLSAGIATAHPDDTADSLFDRADRALYRAKRAGRDRVAV